ncbi:unnamed protein product [Dovyalis caffra]|uniref:Kinesin motor domain-containing protein n=1 Tax=Dovyalis caffra TaxID=77055 RepID=A0AAV1RVY8_9ROSI|nr:unnamed protein product [Dovyalis caffra]
MAEQRNRWNWEVSGFEPRSVEAEQPLVRRYSISKTRENSELSKQALASKVHRLEDKIKLAKEDYLELRQEASDLQEYSNAKLDRVTRYLGVLAEKTRKLDQVAFETEARISPLINEKKRLFNDLLTAKGSIKVFCRARPLFEDESPSVVEFPDDCTIRVNTGDDTISNPKKDFEFDRVYAPHVGQAELFTDVQPFVQSALDGYNVSMFAYGQTRSGKTYTMEGSSHDRGLYSRCFEELFDLANSDSTSTSRFNFSVTVFEICNEQITDLLSESESTLQKIRLGSPESFIELGQEKVDNPLDFSKTLKAAFQKRGNDISKVVAVHIYYNNLISGENLYSKLSLVDLAGSEGLIVEDDSGERVTDMLHVMKSLSALGDVMSSLTSRKEVVPFENSMLTKVLADSLVALKMLVHERKIRWGNSKALVILNVCPSITNLSETLSTLSFGSRARNATLSLGNRDTIKKWRDVANDARKELYEKEKEIQDLKQEVLGLKQALKDSNDQCVLLFNEIQKAWKVSFTLQSELKSENIMIADKHNVEKEQNAQLRNQVAQLLQIELEQKMMMEQKDSTIQTFQAKIKSMESQLNEARSAFGSEPGPVIPSISKTTGDGMDSSAVAKKLEEELKKRDALIERLHEENEKLFDRLTEKASLAGSPQVSSPLSLGTVNVQSRELGRCLLGFDFSCDCFVFLPSSYMHSYSKCLCNALYRNENNKGRSMDVVPSPVGADKTDGTIALVKSGSEKVKSTPAGEYLTAALNDFDPEQHDSLAAISDGANKLLMLGPSNVDQGDTRSLCGSVIVNCFYLSSSLNSGVFTPQNWACWKSAFAMIDIENRFLRLSFNFQAFVFGLDMVLAAVIKAGASREHEILAEIRDAVFSFIRKMEPKRVMDTMLVSRVRILYIRSLLARSPELQSIKVSPVECFLEKANTGRSRSSSRGNSPGRSPVRYVEGQIQGFKVNIKPERKSKLSSVVLRMRGIDQDAWRQQVTGGKLREIQEEAKSFAIGNKALAALFVHTPAGELQRQIRSWLAENFEFLSVTGDDASGGTTGQLELLSTAIMDGWMAGLGAALPPSTDALGQLLSEYAKRVFTSQLQHLKYIHSAVASLLCRVAVILEKLIASWNSLPDKGSDNSDQKWMDYTIYAVPDDRDAWELVIRSWLWNLASKKLDSHFLCPWNHAEESSKEECCTYMANCTPRVQMTLNPHIHKDIAGTLASEEAEDAAQVAKLRSALESVDHKRRKILQQMRSDAALLTLEDGGLPVQNPSTAAEDARLASLISLDGILKQAKDVLRQSSVNTLSKSKKKILLGSLDELGERMPSLLNIDHPCAQRQIAEARHVIESIPEEDDSLHELAHARKSSADLGSGTETDVAQWNVLQFNTGSTTPFIIKCGANSNSELVIKADARVQEPKGGEIVRVVPRPSILENMSLDDMKHIFSQLPEALSLLALARTADGTRARYSRLYRTLAMKVPSLRDLVGALMLQIIGLSLFVFGFFPVKPALSGVSDNVSGPESFYYDADDDSVANQTQTSLPPPYHLKSLYQELSGIPPLFDRLILMVIDGLPAEFVLGKDGQPPPEDFVKAMPYTHSLLSNGMAIGYHAKAAPPTVTMPRLKAMVSGAIGGFLDVAFNFNTQAMLDDNLLGQFLRIGWKMVILGDETWLKLFPGLFMRHDGVKDTVQVDQNVSRNLESELNRDDWNLLILHYLGLDHVGHIGGRSSILMAPKLKEMDEVVKMIHLSTIQTQDNGRGKTLLVVVSDHGMTENGNHGGSSYEETDSLALFVGLKNDFFDHAPSSYNSIYQVDIAPTLALLLGVPIPKNNVGVLISEAFDLLTDDKKLRALELNSWQLLRLIQAQLPGFSCRNLPSHYGFTDGFASTSVECSGSMEKMLCCLYMKAVNLHSSWKSKSVSRSKSRDDYSCTVAAYLQFLKTASEWLSRRVTDKPVGLLAVGIVAMALSSLILLGLMICMSTDDRSGENQHLCNSSTGMHKWSVDEIFILGVVLILVMSMASSSMVEEEQYIWHFVLSTSYVLLLRKAVQPLASESAKSFFKLLKGQTERGDFRMPSIILLLICGRILRGWHQGGVNWTYLPDISKWLEQAGVNHMRSIQLASGLLVISLSIFALFLFGYRRKIIQLVGFCFLICGLLVLWHLYHNNAFVSAGYDAATLVQIIYASLGIATIGTVVALPWLIPLRFPGTCSTNNVKSNLVSFDGQGIFPLVEFRDCSYSIGLAYIICWCLLQLLLQQPINSMPIFLLLMQIFSTMLYFSCTGLQHIEVEVALLYYMGMAGHFALGNSNTLATIDVAGAYFGLSSHSTLLSGILMFIITYASPMLFLLSMLMYISAKCTSYLANLQNVDLGHLAKMMLGFSCLVPLGLNSILLTSYTIVLLLMRNHLFVWSVFSPKYLYACATTVCIYTGVFVVAATEIYTYWVLALRRKRQISKR